MRVPAVAACLLAFVPFVVAAVGGDRCQVADSAVRTPGLAELVMGSETAHVPEAARLTEAQVHVLAERDTTIRRSLDVLRARVEALPAGVKPADEADLAKRALPELVAHFLSRASRECAILIDVDSSDEFRLANAKAVRAKEQGDDEGWCSVCLAVRRGIEAPFEWDRGRFGVLTPVQEKEAAELASLREDLRRSWAASVREQLTPVQFTWLRDAQMRWLEATLSSSISAGMRSLGARKCEACKTEPAVKCRFCSIVQGALEAAKQKP